MAIELVQVGRVAGGQVVDRQDLVAAASSSPTTQRPMNPAAPVTRTLPGAPSAAIEAGAHQITDVAVGIEGLATPSER